jgi:hypothetical protein
LAFAAAIFAASEAKFFAEDVKELCGGMRRDAVALAVNFELDWF